MLDEVPRHVLEPPSDVFTERLLEFAASRAAPLLFRYLAQVNLAFDPVRSDCFAARFVALASWPSLGLWVELRLQLFTTALAHQLLEHQLELSGVHLLGALAYSFPLKLQHHQLQLSRFAQHRIQRRDQQVERFGRNLFMILIIFY